MEGIMNTLDPATIRVESDGDIFYSRPSVLITSHQLRMSHEYTVMH